MVLLTVQLFISLLLRWINIRLNAKKAAKLEEETRKNGWTEEDVQRERERHAFMDLTDKQYVPFSLIPALVGTDLGCRNPFFVYTA